MKNSLLSDNNFLAALESASLGAFHHSDHIRAAWIYLRRLPFPVASNRMAESLRHFAASRGAHTKYHETITQAWMHLVWGALEQDGRRGIEHRHFSDSGPGALPGGPVSYDAGRFDAFAAAYPELLDVHALRRYYSPELLASSTARAQFVPPDLSPLPSPPPNPSRRTE